MNKRNYLLLEAIAYSAAALFCLSLPLWATTNIAGLFFAIALFLLFGFLAFKDIQQRKATEETELVYGPPQNATILERTSYYKGALKASFIVFPLFSWTAIFHLSLLESGEKVRISPIVLFLYKHLGYWPAALFTPVIGFVVVLFLFRKLHRLKQ